MSICEFQFVNCFERCYIFHENLLNKIHIKKKKKKKKKKKIF